MSGKKQCRVCGKPATVFVNLVKTGQQRQEAYCTEHAEGAGLFEIGAYALLDSGETTIVSPEETSRCPECGFSLRDWKRTGRFGCPACYVAFNDRIQPALERLHSDTVHRGKIPQNAYSSALIKNRIRELQVRLENAVREERFEDAAEARDEMSHLRMHEKS